MNPNDTYSAAVENNKGPILEVLKKYIRGEKRLLEIGSGTAQHAVHFAKHFVQLKWVTSDVYENHLVIDNVLKKAKISNVYGPEKLKIGVDDFPKGSFDFVFTANTLHIMSWKEDKTLFKLLSKRLREGSMVFFYGPFKYKGDFTSPSNRDFDSFLKEQNIKSGIRNFEDVLKNMNDYGFKLINDHEMPVNNRLLVFAREAFQKSVKPR
jgi:cyclopropane fatty-acyl-phospholipid synthase-like methyltransferase